MPTQIQNINGTSILTVTDDTGGPIDPPVICDKCGHKWFQQIDLAQYSSSAQVVLGQRVPMRQSYDILHVLECVFCKNIMLPNIYNYIRHPLEHELVEFQNDIEKFKKETTLPPPPPAKIDSLKSEDI
jgi:hypothetical protein